MFFHTCFLYFSCPEMIWRHYLLASNLFREICFTTFEMMIPKNHPISSHHILPIQIIFTASPSVSGDGLFKKEVCPCYRPVSGTQIVPRWITTKVSSGEWMGPGSPWCCDPLWRYRMDGWIMVENLIYNGKSMENPWKWHGWFGVPPWSRKPPHVELEMMIPEKKYDPVLWDPVRLPGLWDTWFGAQKGQRIVERVCECS